MDSRGSATRSGRMGPVKLSPSTLKNVSDDSLVMSDGMRQVSLGWPRTHGRQAGRQQASESAGVTFQRLLWEGGGVRVIELKNWHGTRTERMAV